MRLGTEKPPGASTGFRQSWMWTLGPADGIKSQFPLHLSELSSRARFSGSPGCFQQGGDKAHAYPCVDQSLETSQTRSSSWRNDTFTIKSKTDAFIGRTGEAKARKEAPHLQEIWNAGRSGKLSPVVSVAHRTGVSASQGVVWRMQNFPWLEKTWQLLLPLSTSCTDACHWWTDVDTRLGRESGRENFLAFGSVSQEIAEEGGDNGECRHLAPLSIILLHRVDHVLLALI